MHSSRMHTGRSLTVCWRLLPGGGSPVPGGCLPGRGGGVSGWSGGVSGPRGALVRGVSSPGGVSGPGGSGPGGGFSLVGGRGVLPTGDPPINRMTDRCKNITLATTSLRPVKSCVWSSEPLQKKSQQAVTRIEPNRLEL